MRKCQHKRLWLCLPLLALMTLSGCDEPAIIPGFNSAENWVWDKVEKGEEANLADFSDDADEWTVRGDNLALILTGQVGRYVWGERLGRNGEPPLTRRITVRNAKVTGETLLVGPGNNCELQLLACSFEGPFITRGTFLRPLILTGSNFKEADFSLATFPRLDVANCRFEGSVDFSSAKVSGDFIVAGAEFASTLVLTGMEYKRLWAHADLEIEFLSQAKYDTSIYRAYEASLRTRGDIAGANEIHVEMKRRERKERREDLTRRARWWSYFLEWTIGYGRYPHRAVLWALGMIVFGWGVFWLGRNHMQSRRQNETRVYVPFLYSLDSFLPVVDLGSHKAWRPKDQGWGWAVHVWLIIHILAGWVLITLLLAALVAILR